MKLFAVQKSSIVAATCVAALLAARAAPAVDIEGVQPVAFDQPQVNILLQPAAGGDPYSVDILGFETFNISAFLDTGSSGVVIDLRTSNALGVPRTPGVLFSDVAVGGTTDFGVSDPVRMRINGTNSFDVDNLNTFETVYNQAYGPLRLQLGPIIPPSPILPLDIVGMPAMMGKTVVMDPKPLNTINPMKTYIYDPGTPFNPATADTNPGIPETGRHVQLSYGEFERFTTVTPEGAAPPQLNHNPFIGPNPVLQLENDPEIDNTPPVRISYGGLDASGSFLLDTGAIASFIGFDLAADLNVRYRENTFGSDDPILEVFDDQNPGALGTPIENQFDLPITGIGGEVTVSGFFLDEMLLQTIEGSANPDDPNNIRYIDAPVYVVDITVEDPLTAESLSLDGIFGMNFMVASTFFTVDGGFGDSSAGPYSWVTFDEPNGMLGLDFAPFVPEPSTYAMALCGLFVLAGYAWRRRRARK